MDDIKSNNKMISFKVPSHLYFEKGKVWFISIYLILALVVVIFVFLKQYLGAAAIWVIGIVFSIYSKIPPEEFSCTISKEGVKINERLYPYLGLKSFWIADIFPSPILYLEPNGRFKSLTSVSLGNQPIEPIRRILTEHLPEKSGQGEDIRDKILRIFKF